MKKYECLYIVNINFDSEGISAVVARVEEVLKNIGGELANTQHWGKRKLAYAIDKERYGNYVLLHFQGEDPDISEFSREMEIESGVLHYMTIRLDEFPDFETLAVPQAFEADRGSRRPQGRDSRDGGRRPRYGESAPEEAAPAEATAEAAVEAPVEESAEVTTETPEVAEVTEETVEAEVEAPVAEAEEVEDSPEETPEEDAEKSADAE